MCRSYKAYSSVVGGGVLIVSNKGKNPDGRADRPYATPTTCRTKTTW